jgi:hypothetical protein
MPSPFPGMDPYLEGDYWGMFHSDLATEVKRLLIPRLKPRYYPFTEKYFIVEAAEDILPEDIVIEEKIRPDVAVAKRSKLPMKARPQASIVAPVKMELPRPRPRKVPHFRVAIRDLENNKLVTVIEFLSPINKRGLGRKQYLAKRSLILESPVNLVEVDLLRQGKRLPLRKRLPVASYYVVVSRAKQRPDCDVWPVQLEDSLPRIPIPLRPGEPEPTLELRQAVNNVYDLDDFESLLDYSKPPSIPLTAKESAWMDRLLRPQGSEK